MLTNNNSKNMVILTLSLSCRPSTTMLLDLKKTFKAVCMIGMGRETIKTTAIQKRDKGAADFVSKLLAPDAKRLGRGKNQIPDTS